MKVYLLKGSSGRIVQAVLVGVVSEADRETADNIDSAIRADRLAVLAFDDRDEVEVVGELPREVRNAGATVV